MASKDNENICVVTRLRPMNKKEKEESRKPIIGIDKGIRQVSIRNPDNPDDTKSFTFDGAYNEDTQQRVFYEESCFSIIESALEGFNSTIFAYGQTGCGKSFTMQGPSTTDEEMMGVIPNSFKHIFQHIKASKDIEFLIRCTYLELYNEEVKDLLSSSKSQVKCDIKEDPGKGVFVKGLTDVVVENEKDLHAMLDKGLQNRTVASTLMNSESSRSHSIFSIIIEMNYKDPESGKDMLKSGKLNLVDLAGSERQKKTGAKDATLKEGIKINLSLSALGNVISGLADGSKHIPYRDSKLTRLLQDSLGGNSKTMMIAAISPADYNFEETLSTLRYANRAKNIKNKPKINEDPKDTIIREFKEEINRLRAMLSQQGVGGLSAVVQATMAISSKGLSFPVPEPKESTDSLVQSPAPAETAAAAPIPSAGQVLSPTKEAEYEDDFNERSVDLKEEDFHSKLRAKEEEVEMERQAREEMAVRLQQLEHMLVTNQNHIRPSPTKSHSTITAADAINDTGYSEKFEDLSAHLIEEEEAEAKQREQQLLEDEEAMRIYHERVAKAHKHQEELNQLHLQRVMDEKKAMEDELEELRSSMVSATEGASASTHLGSSVEALPSTGEATTAMTKKMKQMKKKYERKTMVLEDELRDMRDEFSYQRRQLMEALVEGEKDSKLYEQICRTILSEKDLKRILEKASYDEDVEEWIVPYTKRKSLGDQGIPALKSASATGHPSSGGGGGGTSSRGGGDGMTMGASSLLPDINMAPQLLNAKHSSSEPSSGRGNGGYKYGSSSSSSSGSGSSSSSSSSSSYSNSSSNNSSYKSQHNKHGAIVPLLTLLPGGLISSAAVIASQRSSGSDSNRHRYSSRSENLGKMAADANFDQTGNFADIAGSIGFEEAEGLKKKNKNKNKNKLPKSIGALPSARKNGSSEDKLCSSRKGSGGGVLLDEEAGTGEEAGPFTDWGFRNNGEFPDNKPENEYSEDEEFEPLDEDDSDIGLMKLGNNGPYPPSYETKLSSNGTTHRKNHNGKAKKKKQRKSFDEENDSSTNCAPAPSTSKQQSPRFGALPSLPPI